MTFSIMLFSVTIGIIILISDPKTDWVRWLSVILFLAGLASFANELEDLVIPFLKHTFLTSEKTDTSILTINAFLTQMSEHLIAFCFIMFSISYSALFKTKTKNILGCIFFAITLISFVYLPVMTNEQRRETGTYCHYYKVLSSWSIPLVLFGVSIILIAYIKEKNPRIKNQRFINLFIVIPMALSVVLNLYIFRALGNSEAYKLNAIIMLIILLSFLIVVYKYGAMGLRIRVEKQLTLSSINSMSQRIAVLNHTLKNEVSKISMSSDNIRYFLNSDNPKPENIKDNLEVIDFSSTYLQNMIHRIQDFSKDIELKESYNLASDLIEDAVYNLKPIISKNNIKITKNLSYEIYINCDRELFTETLVNIIRNSCEALKLKENGHIKIELFGTPNLLNVSITDNGSGIKKENLPYVFEPFYTTRRTGENFGLGLSFCFKVLQKHDCDLTIHSLENVGTTTMIKIPSFRIVKYDKRLPVRSV